MSDYLAENIVQPITDDFSTDGLLNDFARIDHQHPLSSTLQTKIVGSVAALINLPAAALHNNEIWNVKSLNKWYYSNGVAWILAFPLPIPAMQGGQWTRNAIQVISSGGLAAILFDLTLTQSAPAILTPISNIATIPAEGLWDITLQGQFPVAALGNNLLRMTISSGPIKTIIVYDFYGGGASGIIVGSISEYLFVGQTITFQVLQNSGANQNFNAYLSMHKPPGAVY